MLLSQPVCCKWCHAHNSCAQEMQHLDDVLNVGKDVAVLQALGQLLSRQEPVTILQSHAALSIRLDSV